MVVVLIPVFNDWGSIALLLPELDRVLSRANFRATVLIVDDGSTVARPVFDDFNTLEAVEILHLHRNVGHQRAIAIGLSYISQRVECEAVAIMDGDGEDRPEDVLRLFDRFCEEGQGTLVFAARAKRLESPVFRFSYHAYRVLHFAFTGIRVRVGNFSIVPSQTISRLVMSPDIWNHYAAAVFKSRLPYVMVPCRRAKRLLGTSKMTFSSLLVHGLSAISVFGDIVGARLLVFSAAVSFMTVAMIALIVGLRFLTELAIPGWATYTSGLLIIILIQGLMFSFMLAFLVVGTRTGSEFVPYRQSLQFISAVECVFRRQ